MRRKLFVTFLSFLLIGTAIPIVPAMAQSQNQYNDWSVTSGDSGNTYYAPVSLPTNGNFKQTALINGTTTLAVFNGRLYTVDKQDSNQLDVIDLADNSIKWKFKPDGDTLPINNIVAKDGMVYVLTGNKLYALQDTDNTFLIKWTQQTTGGNRLTYDDSTLFYLDTNKKVNAVDITTGAIKWTYSLGQFDDMVGARMTTGGGRVYFTIQDRSQMQYKLFSLNAATGEVLWTTDIFGITSGIPVFKDGKLYMDFNHSGDSNYQNNPKVFIAAFDAVTGNMLWKSGVSSFGKYPDDVLSVNNDSVFTVTSDGNLIAINKDTGEQLWKVNFGERLYGDVWDYSSLGSTVVTTDKVFLENRNKNKIYDSKTGSSLGEITLTQSQQGPYSLIASADGMLFVTDGTSLYTSTAIDASNNSSELNVLGRALKNANLRSGPGTQYNVLKVVIAGDELTILDTSGDWYQVEYKVADNTTISGYIAKYLVAGNLDLLGTTVKNVNLRKGPGTQYDVIQVIPAGNQLTLNGSSGSWYEVEYSGSDNSTKTGFIAKYLVNSDISGTAIKNANLRNGPGTQYGVIEVVPYGDRLRILGEVGDWYLVLHDGFSSANLGYMAKYLIDTRSGSNSGQATNY